MAEGEDAMEGENSYDKSNLDVSPRFEFVASKPIKAGDEIVVNYNLKSD